MKIGTLCAAVLILGQATTAMAQTAVKHFPVSSAGHPAGAVSPTGVPTYSSAVIAGDTVYVSGTIDIDPATGKPPTDVTVGAKLVLDNIKLTVGRES